MLLKNVSDLKAHLGRAINRANSDEFMLPYVQLAQDEFIVPAVGPELVKELDTQYAGGTLTEANRLLLTYLQRALAWYAYWKYLPFSLGNDGENGLQEQGTKDTSPVRIGVLDKRQRESIENASKSLEAAMRYLHAFRATYPTWTNSEAFKESRSLFLSTATALTEHMPWVDNSYRLYLTLKPYLKRAETATILPLIGQAMFDELKAYRLNTALVIVTERLLVRVGNAVALTAYSEALFHLNVTQTSGGSLRILSDFDGIYNQKAVSDNVLQNARSEAKAAAVSAQKTLVIFLRRYADDYPTYKNSDQFKSPIHDGPDNSGYKGIFRMR